LYGTISASIAALLLNNSAARFCVLPSAMVPIVSVPGCLRASARTPASDVWRDLLSASTTRSKKPSVLTGAKSLLTSKGSLRNRLALTALPLLISSSVYPSGRACATAAVPTMLPALGRLSTTIGWRRSAAIASATRRAVRSAMPPGANGTIKVIGRLG
jgi:hypothetical protein